LERKERYNGDPSEGAGICSKAIKKPPQEKRFVSLALPAARKKDYWKKIPGTYRKKGGKGVEGAAAMMGDAFIRKRGMPG